MGAETWIDSIVTGRRLRRELTVEDVTREVQTVLLHWADDAKLEVSPLVAMAARRDPESELSAADAVRALIREALERARAGAREDRELAFRALELAYLDHTVSHERVAERLSVSRSTFYRLLKRAVAGVAAALGRT
jgi:DNA-binding NtrC family response regulator